MRGAPGEGGELTPHPAFGRRDLYGVAFWVLFSAVAVGLRGVRWDEHYELAQVVTGQIPYPEEHSIYAWTRYVRNLPIFFSSALLHLFPGPEVICFVRNVLWLLATVLPVYLLTVLLTKRALSGGAAVLFALLALHTHFDANYPLYAWPAYFSNGHVGRGFALVTICLLFSGNWRTAFVLLGFLPTVHPGQAPLVFALAFARVGYVALNQKSFGTFRVAAWALPGLLVFVGLWSYDPLTVPLPQEGPYYSPDDPQAIAQAYIVQHPHWALPGSIVSFVSSNFMLAAMLLLVWGRIASGTSSPQQDANWKWLGLYLAGVGAVVWLTMFAHMTLGERIPYPLLAWMPYRFTNHAATFFPAIVVALLSTLNRDDRRIFRTGPLLLGCALIFETVKPLLASVVNDAFYQRYLSTGEITAFGLIGAAAALFVLEGLFTRPRRLAWLAATGMGTVTLALFHQYGAFCIAAGALAAGALDRLGKNKDAPPERSAPQTKHAFLMAAMAATLIVLIGREWGNRETLPRSDFDRQVTQALHARGDDTAMVVSHPHQHRLQVRIEHPVLFDAATASSIVYTPHLAPTIQKIMFDFYGFRFHPKKPADAPEWSELWKIRTQSEWQRLGETYSFRYVISPNAIPLDLEVVLRGEGETLYTIPLP